MLKIRSIHFYFLFFFSSNFVKIKTDLQLDYILKYIQVEFNKLKYLPTQVII